MAFLLMKPRRFCRTHYRLQSLTRVIRVKKIDTLRLVYQPINACSLWPTTERDLRIRLISARELTAIE